VKKYLIILLTLLGTACAPLLNPTAAALPTPIPMSQVDLEPVLVVDDDLPQDLVPDIVTRENAVGAADELDRADVVFTQYFLLDGGEGGGVSVFLFESLDDVQAAFGKVSTFMDNPLVYELVGERARIENFFIPLVQDVAPIQGSRLIFMRCHALAVIQFPRAEDVQAIETYGQRLDGRIQSLVCRESEN
jgi:hypothetical protein